MWYFPVDPPAKMREAIERQRRRLERARPAAPIPLHPPTWRQVMSWLTFGRAAVCLWLVYMFVCGSIALFVGNPIHVLLCVFLGVFGIALGERLGVHLND
jgi:hypothetical protein